MLLTALTYAQDYSASMPPVFEEPGGTVMRVGDSSHGVESIDPFTGALKIVVSDLVIPSNGGLDLAVTRNYQSFAEVQGFDPPRRVYQAGRTATGIGWDLHYGRLWKAGPTGVTPQLGATNTTNGCRIFNITSKNNPVLEMPDGTRKLFAASDLGETDFAYVTADRWILRCLPTSADLGNGGAIVISPNGVKFTFNFFHRVSNQPTSGFVQDANTDIAYHVTKIEHPNGTYIDVNYDSKSTTYYTTLDNATHSEGHSIDFTYVGTNSATGNPIDNDVHLKSFKQSGTNRVWTFNYETAIGSGVIPPGPFEYLEEVVRPDGRKTSYEYIGLISNSPPVDGKYSLNKITAPYGGTIDYFYDQETFPTRDVSNVTAKFVVDKKEVRRKAFGSNAVDTWTYNYRPSTSTSNQSDFTDVSGPTSCTTYEHCVGQIAGTGWKVGALLSRTVKEPNSSSSTVTCTQATKLTEIDTWEPDQVSTQDNYRFPLLTDGSTNAPRISERQLTLDGSTYTTEFNDPDTYGNPTEIVETGRTTASSGNSISASRTTDLTYFTNSSAWIIGSVKNETISNSGITYATPTSSATTSDDVITRNFFSSGTKIGLVQTETRNGITTTFDYHTGPDDGGALSRVADANGFATDYDNYKRGVSELITRQIDSNSSNVQTIRRDVNDSGTIAYVQDGELKRTNYSYNDQNQVIGVTTARTDDDNVVITRTSSGTMKETITRGSYREIREYDGFGQMVRRDWSDTSAGSPSIFQEMEYDAAGRMTRRYLPNSLTSFVRSEYDALGRVEKITQPDSSSINYDYLANNRVLITDERLFQTLNYFRSFGDPFVTELVRTRADRGDSPGGIFQTTHIARNLSGDIDAITQEGITRTFKRNSKFLVFEENHPEIGAVNYTHDNVGNVTTKKVGSSGITSFTLDRLYRTDLISYPDGRNIDFDYYRNDRLKLVVRGNARWDYLYDSNNNLTQEKMTVSAASPSFPQPRTYRFDYEYDSRDSLETLEYPSALKIDYQPNVYGRATAISSAVSGNATTPFASGIDFHPNGQLEQVTMGNGVSTSYGQDSRLRLTTHVTTRLVGSSTETLLNRRYGYDVTSNVSSITDNLLSSNSRSMTYDGLRRLRIANGPWGNGSVTYYSNNNINTKTFDSISLTLNYDALNRLDTVSGSSTLDFGYDVYGNVTSNGKASYGDFVYDDASLLRLVRDDSGSTQIEYAHDGNRRTVLERELDGSSTTYKAYGLSGNLLYEEDVANSVGKDYIYIGTGLLSTRSRCTSATDADADGITDCLEFLNGLDRNNPNDAGQDADGDGLDNATEIQIGTNINDVDSDGDGLSDDYEYYNSLDPLVSDSGLDADGDGLTNLQEASLGTDPNNVDTDSDGLTDDVDPDPLFNPGALIPIIRLLLS